MAREFGWSPEEVDKLTKEQVEDFVLMAIEASKIKPSKKDEKRLGLR